MTDHNIIVADSIKGSGLDLLRTFFGPQAVVERGKLDESELLSVIGAVDALLIRSATTVTRRVMEAAGPRLKLIGRAGVGVDNVDRQAATERGVIVMNTPLGNTISAAEHAIAMIFACARNIARADALMQKGQWEKKSLTGVEVSEKTLGLIGLGKIGSHVARVMKATGMNILACDPFLSPDRARQMGVDLVELDELLVRSDFVSIHTPLTEKTRNLLSADVLKKMKTGARLINCARGGIVDEMALAAMVKAGHLAAAGMDVFSKEPMTAGPLFGVPGITLTPHLGASTEEAEERCARQLAEQVVAYFRDGEIRNAVNVAITSDKDLRPYVVLAKAMGMLATTLLDAAPERVEVSCSGELERRDTSEITSSALQGVLETFGPEDVNVVNAAFFAKQRGLTIAQVTGRVVATFRNLVAVTLYGGGRQVIVEGTAYDNLRPHIVRINEFEVDLHPEGHVLLMQYPDRPGYVGKFGTILGTHAINIASMEVGRTRKQGQALIAFTLDDKPDAEVLRALAQVAEVASVRLISL